MRRLHSELDGARESTRLQVAEQVDRVAAAELQLKEAYKTHEERVALLEQRLAELSNNVGLSEKFRCRNNPFSIDLLFSYPALSFFQGLVWP